MSIFKSEPTLSTPWPKRRLYSLLLGPSEFVNPNAILIDCGPIDLFVLVSEYVSFILGTILIF